MRRRYTRQDRDVLIRAVRTRGESVRAAAARLGVSEGTAYGWMRAAAKPVEHVLAARPDSLTFVELVPAGAAKARLLVRVGGAEIEVRAGFDAALLRSVVLALRGEA